MKSVSFFLLSLFVPIFLHAQSIKNSLRAPAYPLITLDPNMSAWSYSDELYESSPRHWSDKKLPLLGVLKVDNEYYRFLGTEEIELLSMLPNGEDKPWEAKYLTKDPVGDWTAISYDDQSWQQGKGAFGTFENEPHSKTNWTNAKIWVRRTFDLKEDLSNSSILLEFSHDDDAEIFINGIQVVKTGGTGKNKRVKLNDAVLKTLKPGKNVIAAYCFNGGANGFLDVGLLKERTDQALFPKTAKQISADVQPMQTHYVFQCGDVELKITFTAPLFLDDLALLSRPVNYLSYEISSSKPRTVELYLEASPNWALHLPTQASSSSTFQKNGITYLKTGSVAQKILERKGDHVRNDWGYFYMASDAKNMQAKVGSGEVQKLAFRTSIQVKGKAKGKFVIGYDDVFAIQYFGENLRPYWNKDGKSSIEQQFELAFKDYDLVMKKVADFDRNFMLQYQHYGKSYAELCALAYRQSIAAHKLVQAPNGDLLWLSKENDSNGSIGTVDITYPSAPLYLYYNPELAKAMMNFIFYYTESGKWKKPFPAHDIGTYPVANGQTYGGDMPVEEGGNMLILTYAIAKVEGNADYAAKHWSVLKTWADYLEEKGLDPENQLCTDDFAGHFAHNANLSIKAIMGIASFGYLAEMQGKMDLANTYLSKAKEMAKEWEKMANDGDHYRLTFDKPGTWSQMYNMVWDKLFDMQIFDAKIREKEIQYYLTKQNRYGLPLDSRETYTKTDWILWTASMAEDQATFERFVNPVHQFMNETVNRVPMSDWVFTDKHERRGFKARSVVGAYFIKMLEEKIKSKN